MDAYFDQGKVIMRLLAEYHKHGKLIIAVDFDDTIFDCHKKGHTFELVVELLKECIQLNFHLVIFTASSPLRYPMITEYTKNLGLPIYGINKNVEGLPHDMGTNGKIYYNILLDDRAGLFSAYSALREVVDLIKSHEHDGNIITYPESTTCWYCKSVNKSVQN